jgi:hypothetical protein
VPRPDRDDQYVFEVVLPYEAADRIIILVSRPGQVGVEVRAFLSEDQAAKLMCELEEALSKKSGAEEWPARPLEE